MFRRLTLLVFGIAIGFVMGCIASASEPSDFTKDKDAEAPLPPLQINEQDIEEKENTDALKETWNLRLVNASHPLPDDFTVETKTVDWGYEFDARAADALCRMIEDCQAAGLEPLICSAYRTGEKQSDLFENQLERQKENGLSGEEAVAAAAMVVAEPGTSEHESGLAVDICSMDYQILDEGQEETPEFQWLAAHCAQYGFILRYPPDKSDITGVIYEPWHFRYVGEAAEEIMSRGLTLEEYLGVA